MIKETRIIRTTLRILSFFFMFSPPDMVVCKGAKDFLDYSNIMRDVFTEVELI